MNRNLKTARMWMYTMFMLLVMAVSGAITCDIAIAIDYKVVAIVMVLSTAASWMGFAFAGCQMVDELTGYNELLDKD